MNLGTSFHRHYNKDSSRKSIPSSRRKQVIRGYTRLPNAIACDPRLSSDARFLYWLLCVHVRPDRKYCWPGQERLAKLAQWQTKSGQWDRWRVQRALKELEEAALICRERRGGRQSNCYLLNPPPEELVVTDDSEVTAPTVMRKKGGRTHRESASQQCASDAHRLEADFRHENGGILRNTAQQEIADQNGNSLQFSCAQRIYSSLRGGESSSSKKDFSKNEISKKDFNDLMKSLSKKDNVCTIVGLKHSDCKRCRAPGQWPYGYCDECRKAMVRKAVE